ncbi:DUF3560 domain-containing protein [Rhodococcus opacus]|uniref:DUF3560 domain-containing protein n=1 Tax=Rhodococcus opacus TaxID=37919 RepID=UPI001F381CEF|nr:DUF3560 domain-containing protein [Rhodococcus opacus]
MVTISHSAADGTLMEGTSRGDGTNEALKALGWRWFRSLGTWGIRGSRDRAPKLHLIESTAAALRAAGFEVRIEIDATARPTAEVEADRIERQAGRVAALEDKAQRRADQADQAWEADRRAHDALPEGGEPIHVGHHSERRHRRAIETAHRTLGQAVAAEEEAKAARRRAVSAAVTTSARYNPETVKNRIDSLQASQRADQRLLDGHERTLFVVRGVKQVEKTARRSRVLTGNRLLLGWRNAQIRSRIGREFARSRSHRGKQRTTGPMTSRRVIRFSVAASGTGSFV